jgi:hypothetical protein
MGRGLYLHSLEKILFLSGMPGIDLPDESPVRICFHKESPILRVDFPAGIMYFAAFDIKFLKNKLYSM